MAQPGWHIHYTHMEVTWQTRVMLHNALGPESVEPGNLVPGIPDNLRKTGAEYEVLADWFIGADLPYLSSQYVRGDDDNPYAPISDHAVLNLDTRYGLTENLEIYAMARNITNNNDQNAGALNTHFFTGQAEHFLSPGAPVTGYAGIRIRF